MEYCRKLKFDEDPDYTYLIDLLSKRDDMEENKVNFDSVMSDA